MKNQMQAGTSGIGTTMRERMAYIMKHHGVFGLFRGIVPGTCSIFLRNGAAMVVMQHAQKKLTDWGLRK
jgi:solute carrier family 25 carnitine/acylcarnitine transporter 20/29